MNQRGKNNSIIFLTTLSVYLGLVLVGGAMSPVLAQATTRNFNVQDEIEVKDDLDNKPDDESAEISSVKEFPLLFIQLLSEVRAEIESGKYSSSVRIEFDIETSCSHSDFVGGCRGGSSIEDSDFSDFVGGAIDRKFPLRLSKISDLITGNSKGWAIRIAVNNTDLSFKASFTKINAELFAESLNHAFSSSAIQAKDAQIRQVYENSKATFKDNQVFIVTRLPRGSLDKLLKQDAKAEK